MFPVPRRLDAAVAGSSARDIVVGLRPEPFLARADQADVHALVELTVDVAEYIGSSQFLAAHIGSHSVTATVDAGPDAGPMGSGTYYFDTNRLYLFDRQTGAAL